VSDIHTSTHTNGAAPTAASGGLLPRVILHNAVSIDGRINGFDADLGVYYSLIEKWREDATLVGSATILRAMSTDAEEASAPEDTALPDRPDTRPLLVVPDSRGRVRSWSALRRAGYWRAAIALVSRRTPADHLDYLRASSVEALVHGDDQVDLRTALEELAERFGVRTVRVDSGGTLNGVLLRSGLVTDVSVLIHPVLVGSAAPLSMFHSAGDEARGPIQTRLEAMEQLENGLVWLRYSIDPSLV
jgi:2,5-diamino-6-(ribosylamino)-4(3H)-pyrimidinone 5'-phosphate reductase